MFARFNIQRFESLDSTNDHLKRSAENLPDLTVATSIFQTKGKGSRGRSFFSPDGGLYFSVLIKRAIPVSQAHLLTPMAAVAVAEGLVKCGAKNVGIKWVNDIYISEKKVCGILTETKISPDAQTLEYAVIGIGVNLFEPDGGFPEEIKDKAGAVFSECLPDLRERCLEAILDALSTYLDTLADKSFLADYRARSVVVGREVEILGDDPERGMAVTIDDECRLVVQTASGERVLNSGEVSIGIQS